MSSPPTSKSHRKNWTRRTANDALSDTAQRDAHQSRSSPRSDHDKLGLELFRGSNDRRTRGTVRDVSATRRTAVLDRLPKLPLEHRTVCVPRHMIGNATERQRRQVRSAVAADDDEVGRPDFGATDDARVLAALFREGVRFRFRDACGDLLLDQVAHLRRERRELDHRRLVSSREEIVDGEKIGQHVTDREPCVRRMRALAGALRTQGPLDSCGPSLPLGPGDRLVEGVVVEVFHVGLHEVLGEPRSKLRHPASGCERDPADVSIVIAHEAKVVDEARDVLPPMEFTRMDDDAVKLAVGLNPCIDHGGEAVEVFSAQSRFYFDDRTGQGMGAPTSRADSRIHSTSPTIAQPSKSRR
jgi:hypothetical protein